MEWYKSISFVLDALISMLARIRVSLYFRNICVDFARFNTFTATVSPVAPRW